MKTAKKTLITDFTEGNVNKQLIIFAAPLFLSNLLQIVYNMVDMIVVGQVLGATGLSAVAVGGDVSGFLTFLAMGFSSAAQVLISKHIGAGERHKLGRFVGTMCTFLLSIAVILSVVCICLREPLLKLMNTPAEAFSEALKYSTVCMAGMIFTYGYNMGSAILRGMGDSKRPFVFISVAAILNLILDLIFVIAFRWGAMGAALATVISQAVSFISCAVFIYKNRTYYEINVTARDFFHIDGEMLAELVKLGVPMAIKSAAVRFSKLFVNSWVNSYGVTVSAFSGIANKISTTSNQVSSAVNTAGSSMVGQNIGAKKYDRVKKVMVSIYKITLLVAVVLSALFIFWPEQIYGIFTSERAVIELGVSYVPVVILVFFGNTARSGMNALINGSGNTTVNFVTAILDGIILRIGLGLLFGLVFKMGYLGFFLGDALAGFTPFFIGLVFYFGGKWKKE
ncbi:MAG: MATE family efflux transporter [Oscillospiraceae bacterium]|nr:MATE family efflux transporter [Oscillospiraceae bacterium]